MVEDIYLSYYEDPIYIISAELASRIAETDFESVEHPPYPPDLILGDYPLLPKLKDHFRGKIFSSLM